MKASRVFSYADMHANFQGVRFYASLCEGPNARLPRYCKKLDLPAVIAQKSRYRAIEAEHNRDPDYATRFLRAKVATGQTPDAWRHSLEKVCGRSVKSFSGFTATRR